MRKKYLKVQALLLQTDIYKVDNPNKETIDAINELDDMKKNPDKYKRYNNVNELMDDLLK